MPDKSNKNEKILTNWTEVREILRKPAARAAEMEPQERALRDYFGEQKYRLMQDFAARGEQTKKELGDVILLPGIMGSHLSVEEDNDEDHIWVNLWRIFKGDLKRLRLNPDGKTNVNGETVRASGVLGWYYGLALEALQATPFPFDWRLNVRDEAERLGEFVRDNFAGKQVHFVAHSMGGLVVREFIRQNRDLWNEVKGRLVMLGTPNNGSFAAVQGLMGNNQVAKYLSFADVTHNSGELARIVNTFYGLYQLCPAKTELEQIYNKPFWEKFTDVLFDDYLSNVPKFHEDLSGAAWTIDRDRMSYIAGIGFKTASAMKAIEGGGFDFEVTLEGDGTVPHKLGLLKDIPTYYTDEAAHSDLLNNRTVLQAVRDILQFGKTDKLTTTPVVAARAARAVRSEVAVETDLLVTKQVARQLEENQNPSPAAVFEAEKKLVRAILGGNLDAEFPTSYLGVGTEEEEILARFKVQPVRGDINTIAAPVIAAGQYQNLPPQGATLKIDEQIGYWISYCHQNGMIGTALGQLSLIPLDGKRLNSAVKSLIVGGMGEYNRFNRDDLRYLTMNIALSVVTLGYDRFAMVLFGTSEARISIDLAVRSILAGVGDALKRQQKPEETNLTLILVEHNSARFSEIKDALEKIKERGSVKGVEIEISTAKPKLAEPIDNKLSSYAPADFYIPKDEQREVTRLTIERDGGNFTLSAVTANAANPKREICLQNYIVNEIVEKLLAARSYREQSEYGRLLQNFLIPEEFQSLIDTNRSLVLMLNREAAAIPWEMLGYRGVSGVSNFGIDLLLTRQFTSLSAQAPAVAPPLNKKFKALIIADPAEDPALRLAGARREGLELSNYFIELKNELEGEIDFRFETRIGYEQCNIAEILRLIFNEEFDLIHFAGHGIYQPPIINQDGTINPKESAKSGWVFGRKPSGELIILSAQEIFRIRRIPRLVFANACFSSSIGNEELFGKIPLRVADEQIAGLAEAFFLRGIQNYIGAGWQVDDSHAVTFAKTFYEQTLKQAATLGEAVSRAREAISERNEALLNDTWGAYQHYGDANMPLIWRGR